MQKLLEFFLPHLKIDYDVRHTSVAYHLRQIERQREPQVPESEIVSGPHVLRFFASEGSYVGNGSDIIRAGEPLKKDVYFRPIDDLTLQTGQFRRAVR
jgi:hypothetical protein